MPSEQPRLGLVDQLALLETVEDINLDREIATQHVQQRRRAARARTSGGAALKWRRRLDERLRRFGPRRTDEALVPELRLAQQTVGSA